MRIIITSFHFLYALEIAYSNSTRIDCQISQGFIGTLDYECDSFAIYRGLRAAGK